MTDRYQRRVTVEVFRFPSTVDARTEPELATGEGRSFSEPLRIDFTAELDDDPKANKASVQIYNLTESLDFVHQANYLRLLAGYEQTGPSLLYEGEVEDVQSPNDGGVGTVTTIKCGTGRSKMQQAQYVKSFDVKSSVKGIVTDIAKGIGLKPDLSGIEDKEFPPGQTFGDKVENALGSVLGSVNASFSVQNGTLKVYGAEAGTVGDRVTVLTPDTGLVGTPTRAQINIGKSKREGVRLTCLIDGNIKVRSLVEVRDVDRFAGLYLVRRIKHVGSSEGWAPQFYTEIEGTLE